MCKQSGLKHRMQRRDSHLKRRDVEVSVPSSQRSELCIYLTAARLPVSRRRHGLAVLLGAVILLGGNGKGARHHPLYARQQGKVPGGQRHKYLPEVPARWLPELTHREGWGQVTARLFPECVCSLPVRDTASSRTQPQTSADTEARHADKGWGQRPSPSGLGLKHVMPGLSSF